MMNCPGCAFLAINGASTSIRVTVGLSLSFRMIFAISDKASCLRRSFPTPGGIDAPIHNIYIILPGPNIVYGELNHF